MKGGRNLAVDATRAVFCLVSEAYRDGGVVAGFSESSQHSWPRALCPLCSEGTREGTGG